jgi:hypothetical protein
MFASIFTLKQNYVINGILSAQSCVHIWRPPRFPTSLHSYLLQLLVKFELLFPLKSSPLLSSPKTSNSSSPHSSSISSSPSLNQEEKNSLYIIPILLPQRDLIEFRKHWTPFSHLAESSHPWSIW